MIRLDLTARKLGDAHVRLWSIECRVENATSEPISTRLVHWGGNGLAPSDEQTSEDQEGATWFNSIYGGWLDDIEPGGALTCARIFQEVDGARYGSSRPRSALAMLLDAATGHTITTTVLELPTGEEART